MSAGRADARSIPPRWRAAVEREREKEREGEKERVEMERKKEIGAAQDGQTALHLAAEAGRAAAVRSLLALGADPRALDKVRPPSPLPRAPHRRLGSPTPGLARPRWKKAGTQSRVPGQPRQRRWGLGRPAHDSHGCIRRRRAVKAAGALPIPATGVLIPGPESEVYSDARKLPSRRCWTRSHTGTQTPGPLDPPDRQGHVAF